MRIALPMIGDSFSNHFGQSTSFRVFETADHPPRIVRQTDLSMPQEGGCCSVFPALLAQVGVSLVIAGGMGAVARANLLQCGIQTLVGAQGSDPEQIVLDFVAGRLATTGNVCQGHAHGHEHGHLHGAGSCHHPHEEH